MGAGMAALPAEGGMVPCLSLWCLGDGEVCEADVPEGAPNHVCSEPGTPGGLCWQRPPPFLRGLSKLSTGCSGYCCHRDVEPSSSESVKPRGVACPQHGLKLRVEVGCSRGCRGIW